MHNEKYECDVCSEKFTRSRFLYLHKKTHDPTNEIFDGSNSNETRIDQSSDESINKSSSKKKINKRKIESKNNSNGIKLECSSDTEIEKSQKEKSFKKNDTNKSRRKPKTPKKIKINFSKSKK